MSISNILKSFLIMAVGGFTGYSVMNYTQKPLEQNRFMASVSIAKMGQEQMARQFFDLQTDLSQIAKNESDVSEIKITVTALKNLNAGLNYRWILPPGVNMVQGPLQDQLPSLQTGETKELTIKVNGFSKELRKYLSLEISGNANQFPVKQEVLVSSRIEDSLEYLIQQSEKKNRQNGVNKMGKKSKFSAENIVR
ncbi:MAG: hypothetical protein K0R29_1491 [Pseudobdellovibrio sp.]|jgi:hypothetical protein|nr:hypothetical protein [Pseudobdellovibrio sp.]